MRTRLTLGAVLLGGALALFAAPAASADNGAIVLHDQGGCGAFDGNGGPTGLPGTQIVINHGGNVLVVCRGDVTPPSDGRAAVWNFGNTGTQFSFDGICPRTMDWSETVTPNGDATLTIHFRGCS